jgi:hypothetical protein
LERIVHIPSENEIVSEPRQLSKTLGLTVAQFVWGQNGNPQRIAFTLDQVAAMCARAAEAAIERTVLGLDTAHEQADKILGGLKR